MDKSKNKLIDKENIELDRSTEAVVATVQMAPSKKEVKQAATDDVLENCQFKRSVEDNDLVDNVE